MTNFERITQSPAALADFLGTLPVLEAPWNRFFQNAYCAGCPAKNCDICPHSTERENPGWWLEQEGMDGPAALRLGTVIDIDPAATEEHLKVRKQQMRTMTDHDLRCLAIQTLERDIARHKRLMKKAPPEKREPDPVLEKLEAQRAELQDLINEFFEVKE